jgi:hypothetical protein
LIKVRYINTARENKAVQSYGFLIEPLDMLAERTNSVVDDSPNYTSRHIRDDMMDRMAIFNYMIGNTDWSVTAQHNCKILNLLGADDQVTRMVVPYDFDYSGLVDAPYAIPQAGLGITSVRERVYLGLCSSEAELIRILKEFADKKDQMYREIMEFPLLGERQKKNMISYLDEFFDGFDKHNTIIQTLLLNCQKN